MTDNDQATELDHAVREANERLRWFEKQLRDQAEWLRYKMANLVSELAASHANAKINELGEVQSIGSSIDRLCAILVQQREHCKMLGRLQGAQNR